MKVRSFQLTDSGSVPILFSPLSHPPPLFDSAYLFSIYSQHDFLKVHFKWLGLFEKVSEVVLPAKGIVL